MQCFILIFLLLFALTGGVQAQDAAANSKKTETESSPLQIRVHLIVTEHRRGEIVPLRMSKPDLRAVFSGLSIRVEVDEQGNVVRAEILEHSENPARSALYEAAISQVKGLSYTPFEKDGKPVRAIFTEYIGILPPEDLPKQHVPFPAIRDWNSLRITLQRTACFGSCPSYSIEIHGDGSVLYQGTRFVVSEGQHQDQISNDAIMELLEQFRKADYFSLRDSYQYPVTDSPTYTTSIAFDNQQKSVVDYMGEWIGMPHGVTVLEQTIDRLSGAEKWITGSAETASSLAHEHWDFKSPQAGLALVRAVCGTSPRHADLKVGLIRDLIAAGAPPGTHDQLGRSALQCAAGAKNEEIVSLLIQAGAAKENPAALSEALISAANAGDLDLVKMLLKYGANPNASKPDGQTVLMAAAASGMPGVVDEILKYHPSVNAQDLKGQTPVFLASQSHPSYNSDDDEEKQGEQRSQAVLLLAKAGANPDLPDKDGNAPLHKANLESVAAALIQSGANINARNNKGETPLMTNYTAAVVRSLIQAGADLSARDKDGHTALERAHSQNWPSDKIKVLEAAQNGTLATPQ